jgi:hypothetical protein
MGKLVSSMNDANKIPLKQDDGDRRDKISESSKKGITL